MANRTTEAAVERLIEVDSNLAVNLDPFIETANQLVTDVCTDSDYSDAKLELIERWLSAHFYAILDPRVDSQQAGPGRKVQFKVDLDLKVTTYGQQAMLIDIAGNLAALNEKMKKGKTQVAVFWAGTDYYEDEDDA